MSGLNKIIEDLNRNDRSDEFFTTYSYKLEIMSEYFESENLVYFHLIRLFRIELRGESLMIRILSI